jgi:hypothetical protein
VPPGVEDETSPVRKSFFFTKRTPGHPDIVTSNSMYLIVKGIFTRGPEKLMARYEKCIFVSKGCIHSS